MYSNWILPSVATCANDEGIPGHMRTWLSDWKAKQKKQHANLSSDDGGGGSGDEKLDQEGAGADVPVIDGEEGGESSEDDSEDDEPPVKRRRIRMSVDARIAEMGIDDLDTGRVSRSMSCLSRSSRASSVVSSSSLAVSIS